MSGLSDLRVQINANSPGHYLEQNDFALYLGHC